MQVLHFYDLFDFVAFFLGVLLFLSKHFEEYLGQPKHITDNLAILSSADKFRKQLGTD